MRARKLCRGHQEQSGSYRDTRFFGAEREEGRLLLRQRRGLNGFAADCVNKVKNKYKNITCVLVIPYGNGRQAIKFSESGLYDETIRLGAKDLSRLTANGCEERMIEQSDLVIALGGAAKAYAYAEKRKKIVLRL